MYLRHVPNLLAILFLSMVGASATSNEPDCSSTSHMTIPIIRYCAAKDLENADKELNARYTEVRKDLDTQGKRMLRDAQRAWIKFRDLNCSWESDFYRGGTHQPVAGTFCVLRMTEARTKELSEAVSP